MLERPMYLSEGDAVALLAVSSPLEEGDDHLIESAVSLLKSWGLSVRIPKGIREQHFYLAGKDRDRADALLKAYLDPEVKAIFFTRGGYGAPRLYPYINTQRIAGIRKIVVGYSDVTSLLLLFSRACEMAVFHGPNLATEKVLLGDNRLVLQKSLYRHLFDAQYRPVHTVKTLRAGKARGALIGGNLTRIVGTLGTRHEIMTNGRILFLEDVRKGPAQIDAMITHLRNAGKLDNIRGIVFGDMAGCHQLDLLWSVMCDFFSDAPFPVVYGIPSGHGDICLTLPLGVDVSLDTSDGSFTFL